MRSVATTQRYTHVSRARLSTPTSEPTRGPDVASRRRSRDRGADARAKTATGRDEDARPKAKRRQGDGRADGRTVSTRSRRRSTTSSAAIWHAFKADGDVAAPASS